jgi:hypothetical protein
MQALRRRLGWALHRVMEFQGQLDEPLAITDMDFGGCTSSRGVDIGCWNCLLICKCHQGCCLTRSQSASLIGCSGG